MRINALLLTLSTLTLCVSLGSLAHADEQETRVLETSSSGRTIRLQVPRGIELHNNEAVLIESGEQKLAAARVIKIVSDNQIVVYVVDDYSNGQRIEPGEYFLVHGVPLDDVPSLPSAIPNKSLEKDNPGNERFFTNDGKELDNSPELDEENYSPETSIKPKFPGVRTYSPHNITIGIGLFRNKAVYDPGVPGSNTNTYTSYQGYAMRYAYTFRTNYWLKERQSALISVEAALGVYNFSHTFSNQGSNTTVQASDIRDIPLALELRYILEVSKFFHIYPYVGYQTNIVSASNGTTTQEIAPLDQGRILGGIGAQLVCSDAIDARVEGGTDGVLVGLVVKF